MNATTKALLPALSCTWLAAATVCAQPPPAPETAPARAEAARSDAGASDQAPAAPAADDSQSATALPQNVFETRIVMEQRLEAGDFEAALALADHLIELATRESGPESTQLAEAHLLIARIQNASGDYTAAETSILAAIDVFQRIAGPLSATLIDPFLKLGDNYAEAGDYQGAISSYSEARTIGRRNYGLLNEQQLAIIDDMTEAAVQLGQLEEARNLQLEALTLVERNSAEDSLEAIEARFKFAAWLRDHRQYEEERRLYFEIQRIVSRGDGADPLLMVRTLRERARSFRDEDNGDSLGLSGLRDAIQILEDMPEPPPVLIAEVYLDIGDWNVEFNRAGTPGSDYIEAWQWLGRAANGEALRHEWFDGLTVVQMNPVSRRDLSADPDAPSGFVEIYFTVDRSGRARDVEVTDSFPPGLKDAAFLRQYRDARFRPRINANGDLVEVRRARRNEFHYDPAAAQEDPD